MSLNEPTQTVGSAANAEDVSLWLSAIVESSDDAIVSKTLDGIITSWNAGARNMFGYSSDEVIGKPVTLLFPPHRSREEEDIQARLRRGERIEHYETERVRKDGKILDVSLTVSAIRERTGKIIGASKIARDITERKRVESILQNEARILELLNKTGAHIAAKLDLETLVQAVTDIGRELSGAEFGAFFYNVVNPAGEAFLLYTISGAPREAFSKFGMPRNTPIFSSTFHGEGIVRSGNIMKDPRYGTMAPSGIRYGMPHYKCSSRMTVSENYAPKTVSPP